MSAGVRTHAEISTDTFRAWRRSDGFIQIEWASTGAVHAEDARAATSATGELAAGSLTGLLVDMRNVKPFDRQTRAEFAAPRTLFSAIALWVDSPLSTVLANFFLGVSRPVIPTRLFHDEPSAIAWLRTFET